MAKRSVHEETGHSVAFWTCKDWEYAGTSNNGSIGFQVGGSYGNIEFGSRLSLSVAADVTVTPSQLFYNSFSLDSTSSPTFTLSQQFVVPNTLYVRTITTTISLDPIHITASSPGPVNLTYSGSGTTFNVSTSANLLGSYVLTGSYVVSSQNQSVSGLFSVPIVAYYPNMGQPFEGVDVAAYPDALTLPGDPPYDNPSQGAIYSGTIDGVPMNVIVGRLLPSYNLTALKVVPEPSSGLLLMFGFSVIGFARMRRKCQ